MSRDVDGGFLEWVMARLHVGDDFTNRLFDAIILDRQEAIGMIYAALRTDWLKNYPHALNINLGRHPLQILEAIEREFKNELRELRMC